MVAEDPVHGNALTGMKAMEVADLANGLPESWSTRKITSFHPLEEVTITIQFLNRVICET